MTIAAYDDSKIYGQTKTYGSGSMAFSTSGLRNSETVGTVTVTASGGTAADAAVGGYTLTPSAATGGTFAASDYTITYVSGILSVVAAGPGNGANVLIEGPAAGSDSHLVVTTGAWSVTSNASWLHSTSSGSGNGRAVISFDANSGPTRTGTLTVAGQTLTVTQAGSGYTPAAAFTALISGISGPSGVAVDNAGNVYFSDSGNGALRKWNAATQSVTTLVSAGLGDPMGVALDGAGNVYIAEIGFGTIKKWNATTQTVTTLVSAGLFGPAAVAVDMPATSTLLIAVTTPSRNGIRSRRPCPCWSPRV